MSEISHLRSEISGAIGETASLLGMTRHEAFRFARRTPQAIQVAQLDFLDRRHASYFRSNTASFSVRIGLYFPGIQPDLNPTRPLTRPDEIPPLHVSHLQRELKRTIEQSAPGTDLSPADRLRRDIWWVEPDASNLDAVVSDAAAVFQSRAPQWYRRFSNRTLLRLVLLAWPGWLDIFGVPNNIGTVRSPYRRQLLRALGLRRSP